MEKEINIGKKQLASARMSAALDLLIDFLLEEYGKDSASHLHSGRKKRKPKSLFHDKSHHKLI
ncbi:MAG: hypothetical protein H6657_09110 [Ardenticatenaceae bacterium]|nr:hypothetical protein [Ardenticatenaceae bacterium]